MMASAMASGGIVVSLGRLASRAQFRCLDLSVNDNMDSVNALGVKFSCERLTHAQRRFTDSERRETGASAESGGWHLSAR
jgi:hypothetical protein